MPTMPSPLCPPGDLSPDMAYSYSVNATGQVTSQSYLDGATLRETTTSQSD